MSVYPENPFNNDDLESLLAQNTRESVGWERPTQYDLAETEDRYAVEARLRDGSIKAVVDNAGAIAVELYELDNPSEKDDIDKRDAYAEEVRERGAAFGKWFEFHETGELVRYPDVEDHRRLRTARYKNIITHDEQGNLYDATLAVYGLSVGSSILDAASMSGVGGKYVIGDPDRLAPTNLGRIRARFDEVGDRKIDIASRKLSRIDPYVEQVRHEQGFTKDAIDELIAQSPEVIFDAVDNIAAKALMRAVAKERGIALVMASDVGDRSILDVERYDLDQNTKPFHGKLKQTEFDALVANEMSAEDMAKMPAKLIGITNASPRMLKSVMEIGRTVPGMPQLGDSATVGGVMAAKAAREIILGREMPTGRYIFNPKKLMNLQPEATKLETVKTLAEFAKTMRTKK